MRWAAMATFLTAALSDGLDGYLARRLGQRTRIGAILDPLADKLLVNATMIVLTVNQSFAYPVPITLLVLVFLRDGIILGGAAWIHFRRAPIHPKPRLLGKATTLVNCVCIGAVFAELTFAPFVFWIMGIFVVLSAADYIMFGLSDHPHPDADD